MLIILALLFLFCNGNVGASERNRDSEVLIEKTKVMMDEIDRILRDFYNNVKSMQNTYNSEIKKPPEEIKPKLYDEPKKASGGSTHNLEHQRHYYGEYMGLFHDLKTRYADLQKRSQELKVLQEQWVSSKYDKNAYQRYAEEQEKYTEALNAYTQDVNKHNEMKKRLRGG